MLNLCCCVQRKVVDISVLLYLCRRVTTPRIIYVRNQCSSINGTPLTMKAGVNYILNFATLVSLIQH
jgi:hypothetical protein